MPVNANFEITENWTSSYIGNKTYLCKYEVFPKKVVDVLLRNTKHPMFEKALTQHYEHLSHKELQKRVIGQKEIVKKMLQKASNNPWMQEPNLYYCLPVFYKHQGRKALQGRMGAVDSHSLCPIARTIRQTLAKDIDGYAIYDDIDMSNCHPKFLLQYIRDYRKHLSPNKSLQQYIDNREETLAMLNDQLNWSRSRGKMELLRIMNGGMPETEALPLTKKCDFLANYWLDMQITLKEFYNNMTKLKEFKAFKEVKNQNPMGGTLNHFLIYAENKCLHVIHEKLLDQGHNPTTLCFDGIMVLRKYDESLGSFERSSSITNDHLREIEEYVLETTGWEIRLEAKPFSEDTINIKELDKEALESDEIYTHQEMMDDFIHHNSDKFKVFNDAAFLWSDSKAIWEKHTKPGSVGQIMAEKLRILYSNTCKNTTKLKNILRNLGSSSTCSSIGRMLLENTSIYCYKSERLLFNLVEPYLFPIADNKVIDFRTLEIKPRLPEHLFTFFSNRSVSFNEKHISRVDNFMRKYLRYQDEETSKILVDEEMFESLKMAIGYSMTGLNNQKKMFLMQGQSNCGKSSFFKIISNAVNCRDLVATFHKHLVVEKRSNSEIQTEFRMLEDGLRLGYCPEFQEKDNFNAVNVKEISGDDPITYRPMKDDCRTFYNAAKLWIFTNETPTMNHSDEAFIKRIVTYNFRNVFENTKANNDKIVEMMTSKASHVFSWLCQQAHKFCQTEVIPITESMVSFKKNIIDGQSPLSDVLDDYIPSGITKEEANNMNSDDIRENLIPLSELTRYWNKELGITETKFKILLKEKLQPNIDRQVRHSNGERDKRWFCYKLKNAGFGEGERDIIGM